jgi:hypothetical protein
MSDDHLGKFIASKAGQTLLQDVHKIAESLTRVAANAPQVTVGQLVPIEKSTETPVLSLPDHLAEICADRTKLHNLLETTKDWAFTRITPFYSQSYCFRQEKTGFYHFVATLLGHSENQLFAVNIMGDCGCDTYKASDVMTVLQFGKWLGHSYPDYLLSKGTHKAEFQARKAREQMVTFFKEHEHEFGADPEEPDAPLLAHWRQYGQNVDALLANACANTTDLYNLVQEAADDLDADADADICDHFKEYMTTDFFDTEWGMDYDTMDYARIEQMRWLGCWLLEQFPEVK